MTHHESHHGPESSLEVVAERNREAILSVIATEFHLRVEDIRVMPAHSFVSADGTASFMVQGKDGAYGVNGTVNERGGLTNMTTANLQAEEYRGAI